MKRCKKDLHDYKENDGNGCPECRAQSLKEYHERRKKDPNYLKYHNTVQKKWYDKNKSKDSSRTQQRAGRLKTRYWPNLTSWQALAKYEEMLANQEYCCRICEVHIDSYKTPFHVDHCHVTNEVRGLLCRICNQYIVGGIDARAKASTVGITKKAMLENILKYYKDLDPQYKQDEARNERYKLIKEQNNLKKKVP